MFAFLAEENYARQQPEKVPCAARAEPLPKRRMNQLDLNGKHGIVTGGARGIGHAIATRLLRSGASVCLWDRDA